MADVDADLDQQIAHMAGVKAAVYAKAQQGAGRAAAVLAAHRYEGDSEINVTRGNKTDAFVNLDDTRGDHAAGAIEYGRSGGRGGATQGVHALSRAF